MPNNTAIKDRLQEIADELRTAEPNIELLGNLDLVCARLRRIGEDLQNIVDSLTHRHAEIDSPSQKEMEDQQVIYPMIDSLAPGTWFRLKDEERGYLKRVMVWNEPVRNVGIDAGTGAVRYFNPCDLVVVIHHATNTPTI